MVERLERLQHEASIETGEFAVQDSGDTGASTLIAGTILQHNSPVDFSPKLRFFGSMRGFQSRKCVK
jgi:hypothetical protein